MDEHISTPQDLSGYMTGQLLLATPHMPDPRFQKTVIFICTHDEKGAMGIVVNKGLGDFSLKTLFHYLGLSEKTVKHDLPICFGGPVDTGRGVILHSDDVYHSNSIFFNSHLALTRTLDLLEEIAEGKGPRDCLLAMGYVGWDAGQLDAELHGNSWLQLTADLDLIFHTPLEHKWDKALEKLGVSPERLAEETGQA